MADFAYRKTYPLDRRFSVEFVFDQNRMDARWTPHMPKGRKARSLVSAYRAARNEFIASLDVNVLVVEL